MQIVIDIDENLYTRLFNNGDIDAVDMLNACEAIRKGIPLDKIREEINRLIKYYPYPVVSPYQTNNYAMLMEDEVLQIIDKYGAESEE